MELYKNFQWISIMILFWFNLCEGRNIKTRKHCRSPTKRELRDLWERYDTMKSSKGLDESFGMMEKLRTSKEISPEFIKRKYFQITKRDQENLDLCPSYKVMEYDMYRIPETMLQSRCRCKRCRHVKVEKINSTGICVPINYHTRVLRVVDCKERGQRIYKEVWEPVAVGCKCVIPSGNRAVLPN